ncbi:MAG: phage tail protein [Lachnospiraceae bacterium]|nr:phage tail protein [Lachnospiraceae bacterium]
MSNAVITETAREKIVQARAGDLVGGLPAITKMAFGNGGVDAQGDPITPSASATALNNELLRKNIASHTYPTSTSCRYVCTLTEAELAGENINEVALVDADDDIVAIKTMTNKGKDSDLEMTITVDDIF